MYRWAIEAERGPVRGVSDPQRQALAKRFLTAGFAAN
jgi:hypothetical protein